MKLSRRHLIATAAATLAAPAVRAAEPVTLRMSWWGGNDIHKAQLEALRRFEARHPSIRVKAEYTGWAGHLERLTTQIAGDTAPDLMQINWNWLVLFSRDGRGFYDLAKLRDVIDMSGFNAETLSFGTMRGALNGLPLSMAARLFYFNATTFAKAKLAVPKSWDELLAAGPKFRANLGADFHPLDLNLQDVVALGRTWIVQQTGLPLVDEQNRRLNATEAQMIEIARLYQSMVQGGVIPSARERASYGNVPPQEMRPWITGHYAGIHQWVSAINKATDTLEPGQQVTLAPFPLRDGAKDAGLLYRPAMLFAINAGTAHPREAATLMNFLLNDPDAVRAMSARRGAPASRKAREILGRDGALKGLGWDGTKQIESLPNSVRESGFFEHPRVRDGFIDIFEMLGYGQLTAEEAGARMYRDVGAILQRVMR